MSSGFEDQLPLEITAHQAGQASVRQEIIDEIASFSLDAHLAITTTQEANDAQIRRDMVVSKFLGLLPTADEYDRFRLGPDVTAALHTARHIQANTLLWSPQPSRRNPYPRRRPHYIIGKALNESGVILLVARAAELDKDEPEWIANQLIQKIELSTDDEEARLEYTGRVRQTAFNESDGALIGMHSTGSQILLKTDSIGGWTNVMYPPAKRLFGKTTELVAEEISDDLWLPVQPTSMYSTTLTQDVMDHYQIADHIARLSVVFGVEDRLLAVLRNEPQPPTLETLLDQNERLRNAIRTMLLAAGLQSAKEIDELLEREYPSFATPANDE